MSEIEELRQQLSEKDAEIEHLKEESRMPVKYYQPDGKGPIYAVYGSSSINFTESLLTELAASQAREVQLRDALQWYKPAIPIEHQDRINNLLVTQQDTSTLREMIAKAGEVMREMAATVCDKRSTYSSSVSVESQEARDCAFNIRALPGVTLDDIK